MLFKHNGKKYEKEDLLREIYENHLNKKEQIAGLIDAITPHMKSLADIVNVLPEVTKLTQVGVTNDDMLLKMINILSKGEKKTSSDDLGFSISDEERKQLLDIASRVSDSVPKAAQ